VTFDIDANGILNVKAKEKSTGKEQSIKIQGSSGLSKEEIEKMKQDAEAHAADDEKKKAEVETRNIAEQTIYAGEKAVKENGEKVSAEIKADVEAKIADLKRAKEGTDIEAVKKATDFLNVAMGKIGEEMMKAQQAAGAAGANAGAAGAEPKKDDGVKDAEFTEKK
jgi:molecular chaperone DnaK